MRCPICAAAELVHDTRDLPYTYKGETTAIAAVAGDFCPACGESVLDGAESARVSAAMLAFNRQVNASIVDPGFIAGVRKKLALDQREAAEIFGGGVNAFSRYENGKTKPPLALVKLFQVLDRHPELLGEIRGSGQGNRMNAFIMYLAGICPQPTSQTLSTPSLLVGFFGRHHGKRRPAAAGRVFIS